MEVGASSARRVDLFLCGGVTLVLAVVVSSDQGEGGAVNPVAYLWAVGLGLLMLIRRQHPVLVLALTAVGFFSYYAAGFPAIGVGVPIAAALYSAAEMGRPRAALATGVLTLALATGYRMATGQSLALVLGYELVTHLLTIAAVIVLGHSVRTTRQLRRRTEQVTRLLDRQRALNEDVQNREDRLTLARDLHDSIGHALTLAAMHTEIAREQTRESERVASLLTVRAAISDALSHLRRTVRLLRGGTGDSEAPGLRDLESVARAAREAGYEVRMDVEVLDLPPDLDAAAFRVVQEGVTNVLRHSSGRLLEVSVRPDGGRGLLVRVRDDGTTATVPELSPGQGLAGMRERVEALGGVLTLRSDDGGWSVQATIPMEDG